MNEILMLCKEINKSLNSAENAINDINDYGILLAYTNYMFNMGKYYAYMDSLDILDTEKWYELADAHMERIHHMEKQSDIIYRNLKKTK